MSLKIHFLHSYLDFFTSNYGDIMTNMGSISTRILQSWKNGTKKMEPINVS